MSADAMLSCFTGPADIAAFVTFCVVAVLFVGGFVGWLCERQQVERKESDCDA